MHAVVVAVTILDFEKARTFLTEQIVPRVSQAPGFVAGYWVRFGENQGRSIIVFDSEDAARGAANQIQAAPDENVRFESIDVGEVVANA
jgi:hypothetical protein